MRTSSLQNIDVAINRNISSKYDDVKIVADNIDDVETVVENIDDINTVAGSIDDVSTVADNISDITDVADFLENETVVLQTNPEGAAKMPTGTTAERPLTPEDGWMRKNTDTGLMEQYSEVTAAWESVGSAQLIGAANESKAVLELNQTLSGEHTISDGHNALVVDSLTLEDGASLTIPDDSVMKVI